MILLLINGFDILQYIAVIILLNWPRILSYGLDRYFSDDDLTRGKPLMESGRTTQYVKSASIRTEIYA